MIHVTTVLLLEHCVGHETMHTRVRTGVRPEWGDEEFSFTAPQDTHAVVISIK